MPMTDAPTPREPLDDLNEASEHYRQGWHAGNAAARREPLDVERLMRAADIVTETVDITPWTPIWWREVAAEYARLEAADKS